MQVFVTALNIFGALIFKKNIYEIFLSLMNETLLL